ncbi:hypothetical protein J6590_035216 [Homalodisca vitripennis]|nr:hypothetical protein J6590_035216 [Homalodisca vitripennis]
MLNYFSRDLKNQPNPQRSKSSFARRARVLTERDDPAPAPDAIKNRTRNWRALGRLSSAFPLLTGASESADSAFRVQDKDGVKPMNAVRSSSSFPLPLPSPTPGTVRLRRTTKDVCSKHGGMLSNAAESLCHLVNVVKLVRLRQSLPADEQRKCVLSAEESCLLLPSR